MALIDVLAALGVGSLIGTILGTALIQWWQRRSRRQELRRTFREELRQMTALDDMSQYIEENHGPLDLSHELGFNALYEANADQVGTLSDREVEKIVEFYSLLKQIERLNDLVDRDDDVENTKMAGLLDDLRTRRGELLEEFNTHL